MRIDLRRSTRLLSKQRGRPTQSWAINSWVSSGDSNEWNSCKDVSPTGIFYIVSHVVTSVKRRLLDVQSRATSRLFKISCCLLRVLMKCAMAVTEKKGVQSVNEMTVTKKRERDGYRWGEKEGLGKPWGNRTLGLLGSFSRSGDLSKIRTSIVHHSLFLCQTPSHPLRLAHVTVPPLSQLTTQHLKRKASRGHKEILWVLFFSTGCVLYLQSTFNSDLVSDCVCLPQHWPDRFLFPREKSHGGCHSDRGEGLPEVEQGKREARKEGIPDPRQVWA